MNTGQKCKHSLQLNKEEGKKNNAHKPNKKSHIPAVSIIRKSCNSLNKNDEISKRRKFSCDAEEEEQSRDEQYDSG